MEVDQWCCGCWFRGSCIDWQHHTFQWEYFSTKLGLPLPGGKALSIKGSFNLIISSIIYPKQYRNLLNGLHGAVDYDPPQESFRPHRTLQGRSHKILIPVMSFACAPHARVVFLPPPKIMEDGVALVMECVNMYA